MRESAPLIVNRFYSSALVAEDQKGPGADESNNGLSEEIPARKGQEGSQLLLVDAN